MRRQLHDFGQERDRLRLSGAGSEMEKMQVEKERALQEVANLKVGINSYLLRVWFWFQSETTAL